MRARRTSARRRGLRPGATGSRSCTIHKREYDVRRRRSASSIMRPKASAERRPDRSATVRSTEWTGTARTRLRSRSTSNPLRWTRTPGCTGDRSSTVVTSIWAGSGARKLQSHAALRCDAAAVGPAASTAASTACSRQCGCAVSTTTPRRTDRSIPDRRRRLIASRLRPSSRSWPTVATPCCRAANSWRRTSVSRMAGIIATPCDSHRSAETVCRQRVRKAHPFSTNGAARTGAGGTSRVRRHGADRHRRDRDRRGLGSR